MSRAIAIYLFDDIEVLDLGGPFEIFSTASRMRQRLNLSAPKPFEVFTVAETLRPVRARRGLVVQPTFDFTNHPPVDLFILPSGGGNGVTHQCTGSTGKRIEIPTFLVGVFSLLSRIGGRSRTRYFSGLISNLSCNQGRFVQSPIRF